MSLLDRPTGPPRKDRSDESGQVDEHVVSETAEVEHGRNNGTDKADAAADRNRPRDLDAPIGRGLRIRRVRLKSVAKIASVFCILGYLSLLGTLVVLWNAAQGLGFIDDVEKLFTTSLGLETFDLVGQDIFDVVVVGAGLLTVLAYVMTLLMAIVYNATCSLFGGLALETGPLRRRRRVFSLRHRNFVTLRSPHK